MDVLQTTKYLVKKVLEMLVCQLLRRRNDSIQVRLHQIGDDVNIFEVDGVRRVLSPQKRKEKEVM
jgi:hypothetical protein